MLELTIALALFVALHSIPAIPAIRARLIAAIGHRAYIVVYSIVSTAVLAWLFAAALRTDYIELWPPAAWQAWVTLVAAPLGIFLVLAGLMSRNPLSVSLRPASTGNTTSGAQKTPPPPGRIVAITRHPVLWGFLIWSLGHLVPNGDLRSLVLFGGFAAFSAGGLAIMERRARRKFGPQWPDIRRQSSVLPFAAALDGRTRLGIDAPMMIAATLTAAIVLRLLTGGHAWMVGADPLALAFS
jgi:uncharacterized membrane protein